MILEELSAHRLFLDGGFGTMLHAAGLPSGISPELWNQTHPEAVEAIHRAYVAAGSDVITTNTFGAYAHKLEGISVEDAVTAGVRCAKNVGARYVALDVGPTGMLMEPLGSLMFEDAAALFAREIRAGAAAGADFILIETMTSLPEARAAVIAARENCQLPVFVSLTFNGSDRMLSGATPESAVVTLEAAGADAIGVNCGLGPKLYTDILRRMYAVAHVPLFAQPNAGLPQMVEGKTVFPLDAEEFATEMQTLAPYIQAQGGCCGTTPAHIQALKAAVSDIPLPGKAPDKTLYISSASKTQSVGELPLLIGERLNPTGKAKLKAALRGKDWGYLQREALSQAERGVHALDVNVGLPGIDERATLAQAVRAVTAVCDLPLQLDTANPEAMEAGLRIYCGRALINSVSGKQAVMDAVFPIAKKYGGILIALTLDDDGIPATAEGRFHVAVKILETARAYDFPPENIIFDPLAMAISAAPDAASVALESIRLIRERLGNGTSLGVSNISFGLPQRDNINAAFFTLALEAGLSAAILNPGSDAMRRAYDSFLALKGLDAQCLAYIARYSEQEDMPKVVAAENKTALTLDECIQKGLVSDAAKAAAKALETGKAPMNLVEGELIPALDAVGKRFEKGTLFLPQLILSADAAKAAFGALEQALPKGDAASEGTIVLATVQGDIHDIGKNIAAGILKNYRYQVIDLGKDVPPQTVVDTVLAHHCRLCGLSALMTTTVGAMEETIRLLHEQAPDCKTMVGGAVLTADYARRIGADYYCESAMSDVRIAAEVFGA